MGVRSRLRTGLLAAWLGSAVAAIAVITPMRPAMAGQASLIADLVRVDGNTALIAQGNVVVLYEGTRLTASRVVYDKVTDNLSIEGPITISRADGTVLIADAAELSSDLRNGILKSARLVLNEQLQIAAAQINRVNDRYTQMTRVAASSCQVCKANPVPLWQIRADRVVHDEKARQLYFHGAQFLVADVPIFYLPRLRLPDPTLKRATGFLPPRIRTTSTLGVGLVAPFFLRLGDHADLTLSPFLAAKTTTLELRYRQAFRAGDIEFSGAFSRDSVLPDQTRYYVFGEGEFALPRDYTLSFELQEVSDPAYLLDYGYSDQDRLRNAINVMRARRDEFVFGGITRYDTLRESELPISDQLPFAQIDTFYERRFFPTWLGGEVRGNLSWQAHFRESNEDILGRDMARLGAGLGWTRSWIGPSGLVIEAEAGVDANVYWIEQDSRFESEQSFAAPSAGVTLRWPMSRVAASGAVDILEPVAHVAWSKQVGADIPNEDSVFVEFDEANLFDLNRFPGYDRREDGARAAVGMSWTRHSPSGWAFTLAAGRVFRESGFDQFTDASGLAGDRSDWLLGAHVNFGGRFALQGRALLDDDFGITKSETRAAYLADDFEFSAAHIWVIEDSAENRPDPTHELRLDGAYQISDFWRVSADGSFDLEAQQATRAGLGLRYQNECIFVDLSLSRRFTSSINVTPTTDFGFKVELTGFGGARGKTSNKCSG
ncbi:LPS-assembly protein [Aliiroseovarius sediminilitoris]|uniref:LPS-assembly protein LptD n=1 Tax=Aliiroseovarius sediminilitoris TaxID=1173584 RepID=A0A1I0PYB6_9RHOB|nr:LPS assembly protein LptD [Aliiroseovarius sediminilitoris]SEW19627.1 LPS-assembly protein [Aliiroseovarius sediminilitoris]